MPLLDAASRLSIQRGRGEQAGDEAQRRAGRQAPECVPAGPGAWTP